MGRDNIDDCDRKRFKVSVARKSGAIQNRSIANLWNGLKRER